MTVVNIDDFINSKANLEAIESFNVEQVEKLWNSLQIKGLNSQVESDKLVKNKCIEVLEKFSSVTKAALKRLRALDEEAWEKVGWSPEGEKPYFRFQETRIFDSWIHLQDIRDALLQPADDHGTGEEVVVNRFEGAVPYILGKKMQAPEGTLVQINLIGRLGRLLMFKIVDGRCVAVDMTEEQPVLEITTPVALFWRRCAGRIGAEAFLNASATDVRGDKAMAQAFSQAMPIVI